MELLGGTEEKNVSTKRAILISLPSRQISNFNLQKANRKTLVGGQTCYSLLILFLLPAVWLPEQSVVLVVEPWLVVVAAGWEFRCAPSDCWSDDADASRGGGGLWLAAGTSSAKLGLVLASTKPLSQRNDVLGHRAPVDRVIICQVSWVVCDYEKP